MTTQPDTPEQEADSAPKQTETLGSILRRARQDKKVALEVAAKDTRIHATTLKALEDDARDELPAEVFTRGFIKIYAQYLGLNPEEMLRLYLDHRGEKTAIPNERVNAQEVLAGETMAEPPSFHVERHLFTGAVVILVTLILYLGYKITAPPPPEEPVPVATEMPQPLPPPAQPEPLPETAQHSPLTDGLPPAQQPSPEQSPAAPVAALPAQPAPIAPPATTTAPAAPVTKTAKVEPAAPPTAPPPAPVAAPPRQVAPPTAPVPQPSAAMPAPQVTVAKTPTTAPVATPPAAPQKSTLPVAPPPATPAPALKATVPPPPPAPATPAKTAPVAATAPAAPVAVAPAPKTTVAQPVATAPVLAPAQNTSAKAPLKELAPPGPLKKEKTATTSPTAPATTVEKPAKEPSTAEKLIAAIKPMRPPYALDATFREDTWVRIQVDGEKPKPQYFRAGEKASWQANSKMQLFIGNAGGVDLTLNNTKLPPLGKPGNTTRISIQPQPDQR